MKHVITLFTLLIHVPFLLVSTHAQVLDANDPMVVYDPDNPPATPANGVLADWVYTPEVNWNSSQWKSYILDGIAFRLRFPNNYNPNRAEKYPMIVIIHGVGYQNGTLYRNDRHLNNSGAKAYENAINANKFDGFVLSPQSTNPWFTEYHMDVIDEFISRAGEQVHLDVNRVSINGRSGGAQKVWEFIQRHPKTYAAAAPMSGVTNYSTQNIDAYKHINLWLFQGGKDTNPTPYTTEGAIDKITAKGGHVTYTKYKKGGHGIFELGYAESDYFPYFSRVHKANPTVLQGTYASVYDDDNKVVYQYVPETRPCPGDAISISMGVTAGFDAYEWRRNGTLISGATQHEYTATSLGVYEARFRRGNQWSEWSPRPVEVELQPATQTPDIQVVGLASSVLPTLGGLNSVVLELPQGFATYEWRRVANGQVVSTERVFEATQAGEYVAQVTENLGCSSSPSRPFTVVNANGPNKPTVPQGFAGVATSQTDLRLTWSTQSGDPNPATGYELYRSASTTGGFAFVALVENATQWVDRGLSPNTTYYYKLRAVNASAASAATNALEVSTQADQQAPTAPTNLAATEVTPNSVTLNWDEATDDTGVTRYDVYRNGAKVLSVAGPPATVYNLQANNAYEFKVKARDQAGNVSPFSNSVSINPSLTGEATIRLPFNGSLADVSVNATQAQAKGAIDYSSDDRVEGAASLSLSGGSSYVDLDRGDLVVHAKFAERTVALWLKSNSDAGIQDIFDEGGSTNGFGIRLNGSTLEFAVRNGKVQRTLSAPLTQGQWHHVAAVYQSGTVVLYVDGASVATNVSVPFSQINNHGDGAGIGGTNGSNAFGQKRASFNGLIDDFQLFAEALTEEQVARLADTDVAPPPSSNAVVSVNFNVTNPQAAPWNNTNTEPEAGWVFNNLKDEQGVGTGISFEIVAENPEYDPSVYGFSGDNPFGMNTGNNSGVVPDNVMRSTYWMDPGKTAELRFFGLDLSQQYRFRFFASRNGGGNRTSVYRINDQSVKLNAAGNTDQIVQISNVIADDNGEVIVSITSDAGASFSYLGAIIIEASPISTARTADPVAKATVVSEDALTLPRQVTVYPNPYDGMAPLSIRLEENQDKVVTIQIYDLLGSLVYEKRSEALREQAELLVDWPAGQESGMYMLYIRGDQSGTYTQRLLKQ